MIRHLYVHIPFCHRTCPYCGFFKHTPGNADFRGFVQALARELAWAAERWTIVPETVSVGGGTPSILPGPIWRELVTSLRGVIDMDSVREWTLEANPRTFNRTKAGIWRETGVTRVSLGVQSLDEGVLRTLGRDHSPEDALRGLALLKELEFPGVNADLMFAVPGQTLRSWRETLERTIALEPSHVSAYNLTFEEDTEFLRSLESGQWRQNEDRDARFFREADARLSAAGFEHYEVSNYARPGYSSLHNLGYWRGDDYVGIGPSAVSTVGGVRSVNLRDTEGYRRQVSMAGHARSEVEVLTEEDRRMERLALGLRIGEGIPADWVNLSLAGELVEEGLAEWSEGRIRLTVHGMMVADEIAGFLL